MEPLDVIPTPRPEQANPWPEIFRLIALIALMFAAAQILLDAPLITGSLSPPKTSSPTTSRVLTSSRLNLPRSRTVYQLRFGLAIADLLACTLMIAAALLLLRFSHIRRPLVLCSFAWLFIWALGVGVNLFSQGWRGVQFLGYNIMWIGFPVLAILLLNQHGKSVSATTP